MTRLAIIIPVKSPREGKSRLAGELSARGRHLLNLQLLRHTFDQVAGLSDIADIRVVSRSPDVLAEAFQRGFSTSLETGQSGLNEAVTLGAHHAQVAGAGAIMVLPIDLPGVTADMLRSTIAEFRDGPEVMIVADRRADGTNLLLWRPVDTARFHYGIGSASRHAEAAQAQGLRVVMREDPVLSFDLDTPQDLKLWSRTGRAETLLDDRLAG
jgi:2-phospho-L-lactate guanylyltransferase